MCSGQPSFCIAPRMYDPTSLPIRVVSSVLRILGISITTWRIYFRLRIHRFWWEDAWAAVTLLACLASLVGEWIYLLTYNLPSNVGFWFYALGSVSTTCAAHLSILSSIIRILPETRLRKFACLYAVCRGIFWILIVAGKVWRCASNPVWHHYEPPSCQVGSLVVIFEFASDCLTVGVLIVIPLCVLWRIKLPKRQRRMILSVFASSVVLAFTAVFHMVGSVLNIELVMVAGADLENASSIIVCNLLVLVTYVYRRLRRNGDLDDTTTSEMDSDYFTQPVRRTTRLPMTLTTVEIDAFTTQRTPPLSTQSRAILN